MIKTVRINMNLSESLLNRLDEYSDSCGVSRSAAIAICCDSWLNYLSAMRQLPVLSDCISNLKGDFNNSVEKE